MSKIRINSDSILQIFFSALILTLFLCIFFPLTQKWLLLAISLLFIGLLIVLTNKCKEKSLKQIPIEKRYLYEKIGIGIAGLFLNVSALSVLFVIGMFLFEQNKTGFEYMAMALVGTLGGVCLYFGILLSKTFLKRYKSFEIYRSKMIEEEMGGVGPSKN